MGRPLGTLRPGQLSGIWAVVCICGGTLSTLGVWLLGIYAVVSIWGGPLSTLGVQLSRIWAVVSIWAGPLGTLRTRCRVYMQSLASGTAFWRHAGGPAVGDIGSRFHLGESLGTLRDYGRLGALEIQMSEI